MNGVVARSSVAVAYGGVVGVDHSQTCLARLAGRRSHSCRSHAEGRQPFAEGEEVELGLAGSCLVGAYWAYRDTHMASQAGRAAACSPYAGVARTIRAAEQSDQGAASDRRTCEDRACSLCEAGAPGQVATCRTWASVASETCGGASVACPQVAAVGEGSVRTELADARLPVD